MHDHCERNPLHLGVDWKPLSHWPSIDRIVGLCDHFGYISSHPIAMIRRHQQSPVASMPGAVENQKRVLAQDRIEWNVRGENFFAVYRENLSDGGRVADKHLRR